MHPGKAVLVLNGDAAPDSLREEAEAALLVAVDGGGNRLHALGLTPHLVVGDMDSIRPEVLAAFEAAGAEVVRHPAEKLHTDARLALDEALRRGVREIVLAGATGRRLDQTLANFMLLRHGAEQGARMRAVEAEGALWTVTASAPLALEGAPGTVVSVLPLTEAVTGVTLEGFRYPLKDALMRWGDPYGISNELAGAVGHIRCASGVLAVVRPARL